MEERVPLEKPSLTHTSQEPEAQAWAQIGTTSQQADNQQQSESTESEAAASKLAEKDEFQKDDDAASDVQLHVDEDMHADIAEDGEEVEEQRKSENGAGVGEEDGDQEKSSGEGRKGSPSPRRRSPRGRRRRSKSNDRLDSGRTHARDTGTGSSTLTNSNNMRLIRSRVFVGHLNTDKSSTEDVEKLFSSCGNIVGVSLQHGYGFVQFEEEESARKAIQKLHGIQYNGMRLVVDKPVALKKILGEDPRAPAHWPGSRELREREYVEDLRRREIMDRYARIEELERFYYDRYPPPVVPRRDPYYDRYLDRYPPPPPPPDRYLDRHRLAELERERLYDRLPPIGLPGDPTSPVGPYPYERPRDDPYDRREREREREPFEKLDRREPYDRRQPFERYGLPRRP